MFASKDVTLTIGSQTKVHRVGPFTGWNAVMFWGAIVAAVATTVAMATTKWFTRGNYHQGLWRWCLKSVCENNPDMVGWSKAVQALVSLALIASLVALALAIVYTFLHSVNKNTVLTLFIVASWLSAIFMIIGFSVFADKTKEEPGMDFGYSFYLAIVSSVLHILVAVVGGVQKRISDG